MKKLPRSNDHKENFLRSTSNIVTIIGTFVAIITLAFTV